MSFHIILLFYVQYMYLFPTIILTINSGLPRRPLISFDIHD